MGSKGSGEDKPRPSGGLEDTVPASEPPLDIDGNPMRSSRSSIPPATQQRYRLGIELGRGGMGRVVEAFDTQLGRTVALKEVLPKGPSVERRFVREVQITARLEHASIVPLYDAGTSPDGRPFYVMRRVSGRPLDELIHRARGLGERLTLLPAVLAAIDAVAHAHKRGVIHRDLKPANILVGELGETVVIDWGLAKVIGEDDDEGDDGNGAPVAADSLQTQIGSVFGTPGFMAPEQARGEGMSTSGDVYALGATLYHLLAGSPPHAGDSATAVIGRTLKHDVVPLDEAAPGAPPELVAIVDKALAFDAETRYQNAGTLGEDVRRFLAGQLVAAHRYTSRQRLARFVRRHRTALAVAALATVAVAALAWFSVHRIVQERDAATVARREALEDKQAAEAARDKLAERNDALLLTQARALLEANPTETLAVLKQLPAGSARLPEARAIGQAAVARGVWWGMQSTDELTTRVELSPDGHQLLQVSRDNIVRVWDLERRRLVIARPFAASVFALWVSGGRVLVFTEHQQPELLDPAANQTTPTTLGSIEDVDASEAGDRLIFTDASHAAWWFDLVSQVKTPLWEGHPVTDVAISPDGEWGVVSDRRSIVVVDAHGTELLRRDVESRRIVTSRVRTFSVASTTSVLECKLDPTPVCVDVPIPMLPRPLLLDMAYRDRELMMFLGSGDLVGWNGESARTRTRVDQFMYRLSELGADAMLIPSFTGRLQVLGDSLEHTVTLPSPLAHARIATRAHQSRIVVVGDGQILVAELGPVLPHALPGSMGADAVFSDDETLLTWRLTDQTWAWLDLATDQREVIRYRVHGMPFVRDVDAGRALVRDEAGDHTRLMLLERGQGVQELAAGVHVWGRLIPGDTVVFGAEAGHVLVKEGDAPPREVVTLDGPVLSIVGLGPKRFAAISSRGDLARTNLTTGAIERTTVTMGDNVFLAADAAGRVMVAVGDRLLMWDQHIVEIARFTKPLSQISAGRSGHVVVTLTDHDVLSVELVPGATPHRLIGGGQHAPAISADGWTLVAPGNGLQLTIVELGSAMRWTLPAMFAPTQTLSVSPSSRRIVQGGYTALMLWSLPTTAPDFRAWLDEQTNATRQGDDALAWPWQVRSP